MSDSPAPTQLQSAPSLPAVISRAALQPDDPEIHPLMKLAMQGYVERKTSSRATSGLRIPLSAAKLLVTNPRLWPWAIAPAIINFSVFVVTLFFTLPAASQAFGAAWAMPAIVAWYHYLLIALWGLIYLIVMLLAVVLSYMGAMMLGGVIASPFNDALSEKTERILLGARYVTPPEMPFWKGVGRSMLSSAAMAGMYFGVMVPLLLLNLIPVVGSIAYTVIGGLVGGYFVALEYIDPLLERKTLPFKQKLALVWQERSLTLGFGVGTSLMLAIPIINFFCLPIAVIGGTALGTALLEETPREALPPGDDGSMNEA
jgi:CysZ protein